jgi:hypothetical protein
LSAVVAAGQKMLFSSLNLTLDYTSATNMLPVAIKLQGEKSAGKK